MFNIHTEPFCSGVEIPTTARGSRWGAGARTEARARYRTSTNAHVVYLREHWWRRGADGGAPELEPHRRPRAPQLHSRRCTSQWPSGPLATFYPRPCRAAHQQPALRVMMPAVLESQKKPMLRNHDVLHLRPALALNLNNPSVLCTAHVPWKRWAFWASVLTPSTNSTGTKVLWFTKIPQDSWMHPCLAQSCAVLQVPAENGFVSWAREQILQSKQKGQAAIQFPDLNAADVAASIATAVQGLGRIHHSDWQTPEKGLLLPHARTSAISFLGIHLRAFPSDIPPLFLFRLPLARAVVYLRDLKPAALLAAVVLHLERPPNPQLTTGTDPAPDASHVPAAAKKKRPRMQETLRRPSVSKPHISLLYDYDYYYDYCYYYCYHYCYCYCYYYHYSYYYSSSLSSEDDDDEEHLE